MLEVWKAVSFAEIVKDGHTQPMVVDCVPEDRVATGLTPIFVKALDPPEVDEAKLFRELFGCMMALRLGLFAPLPCLVHFDEETAAQVTADTQDTLIPRTVPPGFAAGFQLVPGLIPGGFGTELTPPMWSDARSIFAFDEAAQNDDRVPYNENCAIKDGRLLAFDFGSCFECKPELADRGQPWEFAEHDLAPEHLFYERLRGRRNDWAPFVDLLRTLTEAEIDRMGQSIPLAWRRRLSEAAEHLIRIVGKVDEVPNQLNWCLA